MWGYVLGILYDYHYHSSYSCKKLRLQCFPQYLHLFLTPQGYNNIVFKYFVIGVTVERFEIVAGTQLVFINYVGTYKLRQVLTCDGPSPNNIHALIWIHDRPTGRKDLRLLQLVEWCAIKFGKEVCNSCL